MYILSNYEISIKGGILMPQKMTSYFNDFLKEIRLTTAQVNELKSAHTTLRERLMNDENYRKESRKKAKDFVKN